MLFALRLLDAFHLTFTRGKHLFMLKRATVSDHSTSSHPHITARPQDFNGMVHVVASVAMWSAAAWPALRRGCGGPRDRCRARERDRTWPGSGRAVIL